MEFIMFINDTDGTETASKRIAPQNGKIVSP